MNADRSAPSLSTTLSLAPREAAARGLSLYAWPLVGRRRVVALARDRRQALSAVRSFGSAPQGRRGRVKHATATAHPALVRRIVEAAEESAQPSVISVLAALLPGTDHLAGRTGGVRANQKPVVMVFDSSGMAIAVVKVATNDLTRRLLANEHSTLRALAAAEPTGFAFPHLLAYDPGEGVLAMEALDISTARPLAPADSLEAVELIAATAGAAGQEFLTKVGVVRDALAFLDRSPQPYAAEIAATGRAALSSYRQHPVRTGAWHGDWTQHNAGVNRDGFLIWDWERYEVGAPVGFDELHRRFQDATKGRPGPQHVKDLVAGSVQHLAPLGVAAAAAPGVSIAYLVTIAARYLRDDQRAYAAAVGAVEDWLVGPMAELADRATPSYEPGVTK